MCDIAIKKGNIPGDPESMEILRSIEVLKTDSRIYTSFLRCVAQVEFLRQKVREFGLDVVWTTPMHQSHDRNKVLLMFTYGRSAT